MTILTIVAKKHTVAREQRCADVSVTSKSFLGVANVVMSENIVTRVSNKNKRCHVTNVDSIQIHVVNYN